MIKNFLKGFIIVAFIICVTLYVSVLTKKAPLVTNIPAEGVVPQVAGEVVSNVELEQEILPLAFEKKVFGVSTNGKNIEGYEIGRGKNIILLHASIHGDEMGTVDLLNKLIEEIQIGNIIVATSTKLVVVPIVNPDGYFDRTDKLNANKVNLNLNFATSNWQEYGPQGTYAGKAPFSEKESQVLKNIVDIYKPALMIAYHSEGALVSPESGKHSIIFAKWYAQKTGYSFYEEWDFSGTATKWFEEYTGKPAITVELTKRFVGDWSINKKALIELITTDLNLLPIGLD